jgi:phage antirepressor YoqD-like protein
MIAFAESVGECASLISINDFAKTTYGTFRLGQKKLFQEMRYNGILSSQNRPYQCYIKAGYFQVVTRVINGRIIYLQEIYNRLGIQANSL